MAFPKLAVQLALLSTHLATPISAFNPSVSPLSCTDLTAVSCVAKGLNQCCVAGGDCCPDGSCCGVGQTCLSSGSGYQCCNTSTDCPNASKSASAPGSTPFHAQIPCVPAEGDSWYCDYGQSCGFASGSCIGVARGGNGGTDGSSGGTGSSGSSGSSGDSAAASSSPSGSASSAAAASGSSKSNSAPERRNSGSMDVLALLAMYVLA